MSTNDHSRLSGKENSELSLILTPGYAVEEK